MTTGPWKRGENSVFIPKWLSTLFFSGSIFAQCLRKETLIEQLKIQDVVEKPEMTHRNISV